MPFHTAPTIASLFGVHLPPTVALLLTLGLIVYLFRRDIREKPNVSGALWLPLLWLLLNCSRSPSMWLNILGLPVSVPVSGSAEEGSPLDAFFLLALITAGFCILLRRQVNLSEIVRTNGWLIALLAYCFISIAWSDYPFISFKRWIKSIGHPMIALIVLTEPDPVEAPIRLMKRCAYVVVPVSILFIKYYPVWGRYYEAWTGLAMNKGIAVTKNMLGADCMLLGLFFFWYSLQIWRTERSRWRTCELWLAIGFLLMIGWLFHQAHSATGLTCFLAGVMVMMLVRARSVDKRLIEMYLLITGTFVVVAELAFGISGQLSETLGRGSTLSGRTILWAELLKLHTNPILGTGFESFWLGKRLEKLEGIFFFIPNEAHNGYLEIYLNLGLLGLAIVIALIVATYWKIRGDLFRDLEWGRYRLGLLAAVVLYSLTEAGFRSFHPVWLVFCMIAMEYSQSRLATADGSPGKRAEDFVCVETGP
jgi:exopolysaccharide production protein ExoQ